MIPEIFSLHFRAGLVRKNPNHVWSLDKTSKTQFFQTPLLPSHWSDPGQVTRYWTLIGWDRSHSWWQTALLFPSLVFWAGQSRSIIKTIWGIHKDKIFGLQTATPPSSYLLQSTVWTDVCKHHSYAHTSVILYIPRRNYFHHESFIELFQVGLIVNQTLSISFNYQDRFTQMPKLC